MAKSVDCGKVNPASGCGHVVRAETEDELMKLCAEHAKTHGMEPTADLMAMVKQFIETS